MPASWPQPRRRHGSRAATRSTERAHAAPTRSGRRLGLTAAVAAALLLATASSLAAAAPARPAPPASASSTATAAAPAATSNPFRVSWWTTNNPTVGNSYSSLGLQEQFSSPAVGDLYGNGQAEVVVGSVDGRIYIYRASDGALLSRFAASTVPGIVTSSPALADLDGDGKLEIVVGFMPANPYESGVPAGTPTVAAFRPDGSRLWGVRTCSNPQSAQLCDIFASPVIADVDGDGLADVIITSQDTKLHVLRGLTGQELPGFPFNLKDTSWSTAAVADLYGNGQQEIVVASDADKITCQLNPDLGCTYGSVIRIINSKGQLLALRAMNGETPFSSPAIGHIAGAGNAPQIVIGSGSYFSADPSDQVAAAASKRVWAFDNHLNPLPGWPMSLAARNIASPALADVDGNGLDTVYTIDEAGFLYAIGGNGQARWFACARNSTAACNAAQPFVGRSSPVVADVNGDGELEVMVATEGVLRVYDAKSGAPLGDGVPLYPYPPGGFALAATPTVTELDGHATVFAHGLLNADGDSQRSGGDKDWLVELTATSALGDAPWPTFHGNAAHTGTTPAFTPAPPTGCATKPNGKYVAGLFHDLLGTTPTAAQYVGGCTILSQAPGIPGRLFLATLEAHSRPWVTQVVQNLYRQVLGRAGDAQGVNYWVGRILAGMYQRDVAIAMYGSSEQYQRWGGTADDASPYVRQLYAVLLGRAPDAGGLRFWSTQALARGPAWVAANFYQSLESRKKRVKDQYRLLLCRNTDSGGLGYWANVLLSQDDLALTAQLVSSNEYYATKVYGVCPLP